MFNFIAANPSILNFFAIIIGWMVINHQNNKRETRKETRLAINDIQVMITELTGQAISYHTEKRSQEHEAVIASSASLISKKIQLAVKPLDSDHSELINEFKNAVMVDDNFGGDHSPLLDGNDIILQNIRRTGQQLSLNLEECYSSKYH